MRTPGDYERTKTLRRAFELLALIRQCPRALPFLAAQLGVTERTVRRDLYTLEQAGIPLTTDRIPRVLARRGPSGDFIMWTTVWRVMPGARCPICHADRSTSHKLRSADPADLRTLR